MSETAPEKSRGLKFAEQQLLRHGWEQGKGLGRAENGISEAIRVKVKCDKGGVGHKESEQFTFHWWDHVFNKASASLAVESDQNGVVVKKMEEKEDEMISNKKPRKAMMNKSMLYGSFVKSATLFSGQEQPEQRSSASEDSSSEDEEKLDFSSIKNLSDAELMKACGGRTAHKGARHGLTMSAKLARLEQQEEEFMAKYGKKKHRDKTTSVSEVAPTKLSSASDQERSEKTKQKKDKKKKQCSEPKENGVHCDSTEVSHENVEERNGQKTKRKKRSNDEVNFKSDDVIDSVVDTDKNTKKTELVLEEESAEIMQEADVAEIAEHQPRDKSVSKEKRKKKKHTEKSSALEEGQSKSTVLASEESAETSQSHGHEKQEEGTGALYPISDVYKKTKKKSSKANKSKSPATETDICYSLDASTAETVETADVEKEASQSKKRKSREEEVDVNIENRLVDKPNEKKKKKKKHTK